MWNKRSRGCIGNRAAAKALLSQWASLERKLLLFAPTTVFPPRCLKHKLLDSTSSRPVSKGRCSRCGKRGKSVYEVGACEASEHTKLQRFTGGGKKRERQRGKKQPPGLHSTSHTIIKSNGVRASASELLLVQFLAVVRASTSHVRSGQEGSFPVHTFSKEPSHTNAYTYIYIYFFLHTRQIILLMSHFHFHFPSYSKDNETHSSVLRRLWQAQGRLVTGDLKKKKN